MTATMKIEGLDKFNQMLDGLKKESDTSERLMKLISQRIRSMQMKHFKDEVDSQGVKWKDLAPATIKARSGRVQKALMRKLARGMRRRFTIESGIKVYQAESEALLFAQSRYPKLQVNGILKNLITAFSDSKSAGAGVPDSVPYGRIHQFGGKAGRGHKVTIPKREYLYINDAEKEILTNVVIKQMIQSQLGGN